MASKDNIATKVDAVVRPVIEGLGIDLVETEYVKEGSKWFLRLYIDKPGGVGLDDCQLVNDSVTDLIDEADPISGPYTFEVSSPGLDRPLKTDRDFTRNIGEIIEISLYAPDEDGNKAYEGILQYYKDGVVTLEDEKDGHTKDFEIKKTALIKKAIRF